MKSNELRIGNWVNMLYGPVQIDHFTKIGCHFTDGNGGSFASIKPIPLIEDWLVKFGLSLNEWFNENSFKITKDLDYGFEMHLRNASHTNSIAFAYFKYVHHLQNLYFALTNEELQIKES